MAANDDAGIFLCTQFDMHPYECGGSEEGCFHCKSVALDNHDPATCALCHYMDEEVPANGK